MILQNQTSGYDNGNLLRFSILVKLAKTDKGLVEAFRSAYFGTLNISGVGITGDGEGDPFGHSTAEQRGDAILSDDTARLRLLRQLTNDILEDFLVGPLEVTSSEIKHRKKKEFRNLAGEKYSALWEKEYTEKDKHFDNIRGTKTINTGTGKSGSGSDYFISKHGDNSYATGLNKEQNQTRKRYYIRKNFAFVTF